MTEVPVSPLLEPGATRSSLGAAGQVEIVAPDRYCTALLLEHVAPLFPAEIVAGPGWTVRLQPPNQEARWVLDLLSVLERWLESARLPCAKVLYGGRSYLIRAGIDIARLATTGESAASPASGAVLEEGSS